MPAVIIDTNVIVVANTEIREDENGRLIAVGMADHATPDCIDTCQNRLTQILSGGTKVVLDDKERIIGEYRRNVEGSRQNRAGDLFWAWLMRIQWSPEKCAMVRITPLQGNGTEFEEFPEDAALNDFDKDDRKFIAVAMAYARDYQQTAPILQAVDTKWEDFIEALQRHGVEVEWICEVEST